MKITILGFALIIGLSVVLMPALVRAPQPADQQQEGDPARAH